MKKTLDEIARNYASNKTRFRKDVLKECDSDNYNTRESHCFEDFKAGAEWQSKQSPWTSVSERLPNDYDDYSYLVAQDVDGLGTIIVSEMFFLDGNWYEMSLNEEQAIPENASTGIVAWTHLPVFNRLSL